MLSRPPHRAVQAVPQCPSRAHGDYLDWLPGRKMGDRDRNPDTIRLEAIFVGRLWRGWWTRSACSSRRSDWRAEQFDTLRRNHPVLTHPTTTMCISGTPFATSMSHIVSRPTLRHLSTMREGTHDKGRKCALFSPLLRPGVNATCGTQSHSRDLRHRGPLAGVVIPMWVDLVRTVRGRKAWKSGGSERGDAT